MSRNLFRANRPLRAPALERAQFNRLYEIHRLIKGGRYPNAPRLAEHLEVRQRTVERDLRCLRDMLRAPLVFDYHRRGYFYAKPFDLPSLSLNEGEVVAVFLAQKLLAQVAGTLLEEPVRSAFLKIQQWLPGHVTIDEQLWEQALSFQMPSLRGDEHQVTVYFRELEGAIAAKHAIFLRYYTASRDEMTERQVDPYHLIYYQGAWYLIAYCHLRCAVQTFSLDRIRGLQVLEEQYQPQAGFSRDKYLGEAFGIERGKAVEEVAIRFDEEAARFVRERRWHDSQEMEELPGGGLILKLRVSGLGEVKRWVLSYGPHAEVISPAHLREELAREAQAIGKKYN